MAAMINIARIEGAHPEFQVVSTSGSSPDFFQAQRLMKRRWGGHADPTTKIHVVLVREKK